MQYKTILLIALLLIVSQAYSQTRIDSSFSFQSNPNKMYSIYVPSGYDPGIPSKLLVGFHPFNVGVWNSITWCDTLVNIAETNNLLVVCPDGGTNGIVDDPIDTAFTTALLDSMEIWYNVDTNKVYAMGFSVGGRATYTYSLSHPNRIFGMVPIGAAVTGTNPVTQAMFNNAPCKPVYIVHGSLDIPNTRFFPMRSALITEGAHVNSLLMTGVGHTIAFPNKDIILSDAFQWVDSVNCAPILADAGPDIELCLGLTSSIGGSNTGSGGKCPYTYQWAPSTGLNFDTVANPMASPLTNTLYTVTVTDAKGNSSIDSMEITINPLPLVTASGSDTICNGDSASFTATGGVNYVWSPALALDCPGCQSTNAFPSTGSYTYTVQVSDSNTCVSSDTVTLLVNNLPILQTSGSATICMGESANINVSGASSYSWTPSNGLSCTNCPDPIANPGTSTVYSVTGTDTNSCSSDASVSVIVNPLPITSITPSLDSICSGDSIEITASGGSTYLWTPGNLLNDSMVANPIATPDTNTTYIVNVTDNNNCSSIDSSTIIVLPVPNSEFIATYDNQVLNGFDLTVGNIVAWEWDFGDGNQSQQQNPLHTYAAPGTYTLCLTTTNNDGCSDTKCIEIVVTPVGIENRTLPKLEIFPNPTSGIITINLEGHLGESVEIQIIDMTGKALLSKSVYATSQYQLDLSYLAKGIYFLTMETRANVQHTLIQKR